MADRSLVNVMAAGFTSLVKAAPPGGTVPVRNSLWGWVRESAAGAWQKGVTVDPLGALVSFSPVYSCVTRIANDIAKLGLVLLELQPDGTTKPAIKNSPYWKVLRKPNQFQNRIQWVVTWLIYKLLYGNAYGVKIRDARGIVTDIYILDPRKVTPMVTPDGDVYYSLGGDDLSKVPTGMVVPASEIIHDRMNTLWHPLVGVPPIYACALSATQGMRIQQNSAIFFENMSRPSGILTAPATISEETAERLKREFESNFSGQKLGRLAVMGDGLTYEAMTQAAEQSQLVEQLGWTVEDVGRAFSMPLYKIGAGQMPSNNNIQALNQQYYSDCLQMHIEAIELCLDEGLAVPDGYGVEFDLDGLLRMDSATQIEVLSKAVGGSILAPNEARAKLNRPPKAGGDSIYLQQQNYSLEALAKRDAKEDPFSTAKPAAAPAPASDPAKSADDEMREFLEHIKKGIECEQT